MNQTIRLLLEKLDEPDRLKPRASLVAMLERRSIIDMLDLIAKARELFALADKRDRGEPLVLAEAVLLGDTSTRHALFRSDGQRRTLGGAFFALDKIELGRSRPREALKLKATEEPEHPAATALPEPSATGGDFDPMPPPKPAETEAPQPMPTEPPQRRKRRRHGRDFETMPVVEYRRSRT